MKLKVLFQGIWKFFEIFIGTVEFVTYDVNFFSNKTTNVRPIKQWYQFLENFATIWMEVSKVKFSLIIWIILINYLIFIF